MRTKILLVLLLSAQLVQADQFKVHYSIHGSGKDIIVSANNSDDARYTVQDMFPSAVVKLLQGLGASKESEFLYCPLLRNACSGITSFPGGA